MIAGGHHVVRAPAEYLPGSPGSFPVKCRLVCLNGYKVIPSWPAADELRCFPVAVRGVERDEHRFSILYPDFLREGFHLGNLVGAARYPDLRDREGFFLEHGREERHLTVFIRP